MKILIILIVTGGALWMLFSVLMRFRTDLIYKHRTKRLKEVGIQAKQLIAEGNDNFLRPFDDFDKTTSYNKMMWQLSKWRYSDFYR